MKKIINWIKSLLIKKVVIDTSSVSLVQKEINAKIEKKLLKVEAEIATYENKLNELVLAYLGQKYKSKEHMEVAYYVANNEWRKICKDANRRNKNINLNKEGFKNQVNSVITKIKQNEVQNK